MAKKHRQADHRADTRGGALSGLPHVVSDSVAYLSLDPFQRAVLGEILRRFNGYNNGEIGISYEEIGQRLKGPNASLPNNRRIARSIAVLMERGFIAEPTPESWLERLARTYRLTFISSGKAPPFKCATNEYRHWTPTPVKNVGDAGSPEKPTTGDARSPEPILAGDARSPEPLKNGSFASGGGSVSGDAGSLLIVKPYRGPKPKGLGWWSADRSFQAASLGLSILIAGCGSNLSQSENPKKRDPNCESCGDPVSPADRGMPKRFCKEACRKRAERQRARSRMIAARTASPSRMAAAQ